MILMKMLKSFFVGMLLTGTILLGVMAIYAAYTSVWTSFFLLLPGCVISALLTFGVSRMEWY